MNATRPSAVVWDLGAVLIDWDPRYLYRTLLPDEAAVERFLAEVCTPEWNRLQDEGRLFAEGVAELAAEHPDEAPLIHAYFERWDEMLGDPIEGSLALFEELGDRGVPQYALTNWSAETFPRAWARFPFLRRFAGVVVSGREGVAKPDPAVYRILLERHGLSSPACLFVDDVVANVATAEALGFATVRFTTPEALRASFVDHGLLEPGPAT